MLHPRVLIFSTISKFALASFSRRFAKKLNKNTETQMLSLYRQSVRNIANLKLKHYPANNSTTLSSQGLENSIFFALIIVLLIPVWAVEYFPSQDGPIHRWLLQIMADYDKSDQAILRKFLVQNWALEPNMGFYLITYPISRFVSLYNAEKIFLSIYTFLFAYGVRYTIVTINPGAAVLSFLVLPTIFSYYIHIGFYNFQLGVALFFPAIAYSISIVNFNDSKHLWKIGVIATGLAIVHLVPFGVYAFTLALFFVAFHSLHVITEKNISKAFVVALKTGSLLTIWMLPSILIFLSFTQRHGVSETAEIWPKYMLGELLKLRFMQSFSSFEMTFVVMPLVFLIALTAGMLSIQLFNSAKKNVKITAIFAATIGVGLMYIFFPFSSKDVPLNPRLAPILFLLGLMVISFASPKRVNYFFIIAGISVVVCLQSILRFDVYQIYSSRLESLESVQVLIRNSSTFLNVTLIDDNQVAVRGKPLHRTHKVYPMLHAGANAAVTQRSIYMRSSLMSPSKFGYFPYTYRKNMDPYKIIGMDIESVNPSLDIDSFHAVTGEALDYIVVIGPRMEKVSPLAQGEIAAFKVISDAYEHVTSSADGWYHVYALRQDQYN